MADQSIFTKEPAPVINEEVTSRYVGDGKKYKTFEEMDKGLDNANDFINQLKTEGVQLREELDKRLNAEDMVEQIKREREEFKAQVETPQGNTTPKLDDTKLADLISSTLDTRESNRTRETNILSVDTKMKELYGEKAAEVLHQKATENEISVEFLMGVAAKSPKAFFNTLGISAGKVTTPSTMLSGTNTQAVTNQNNSNSVDVGTWKYFEELRKSNPKEYYKPAVQNQLFKMRKEKGPEAFYN